MSGIRYKSQVLTQSVYGDRYEEVYRIQSANDVYDAQKDGVVPKLHDQLTIGGTVLPLFCHTLESRQVTPRVFDVKAVWEPPGSPVWFPLLQPQISWSVGAMVVRRDVSLTGKKVGSAVFALENGTYTPTVQGTLTQDSDAEFGWDQLLPTLDIQVRCARTAAWNPALVVQCTGMTNAGTFVFPGGYAFNEGELLFLGGNATSIGPSVTNYEIVYNFSASLRRVAPGLPMFVEDTNTSWSGGRNLPVRYGLWTRWNARWDDPFADSPKLIERLPVGISVFEAHPTVDLSVFRFQ